MSLRRRCLQLAAVLGAAVVMLPAVASSEEASLPVEAVNEGGVYGEHHRWSPSLTTVLAVGVVTFSNPTTVAHGVEWIGGPAKPSCEEGAGKVPVGTTPAASATKWSGKCTFSQSGTYTFYCTVHGAEMTGTITVTSPGAPTATTGEATAVGQAEATLKGTVNPDGKLTKSFFEWARAPAMGR